MINQEQADVTYLPIVDFGSKGDIQCGNCISACCRQGVAMPLTPKEAEFMRDSGTELETITEVSSNIKLTRKDRHQGVEFYELKKACGNLVVSVEGGPGVCMAFNNPERPAICGAFEEGSFGCRAMRRAFNVPNDHEPLQIVPPTPVA